MFSPSINNFMKENESFYSLVIAVSKRAREIVDDANENEEALIEKPVSLAVEEFARGEYRIAYRAKEFRPAEQILFNMQDDDESIDLD